MLQDALQRLPAVTRPQEAFRLTEAVIKAQIELLQRELRGPGIHFSWNNPEETLVEAFLTRGDRRMADVIELA
ncbi:MAG: hypothetical protein N3A60_06900, partial [Thermanaerothrix sp.]|nr:hypothetical protein [Thermanaerothrix sp.]